MIWQRDEAGGPGADRPGALILGGAHGSLAVARSLGRRGVRVWFVTHDHPIARHSRHVARSFDWPGPDHPGAAAWLLDFAGLYGLDGWTLFAGGDDEVRLVARHHGLLARTFRLTSPPWAVARIACDKRLTHHYAESVGLDSPWSRYPRDRRAVEALDCRFPVILKPTFRAARNAFTLAKAWRADDRAALLARYDEAAALVGAEAIVIQELIPGAGDAQFSYAGVWRDGAPIAWLVARRARQYPVDFGFTSTCVETIEQAEIEAAAGRFLAPLRFSGLVEVEFKYDRRDGRTKLLDVNPRPWTWIGLGAAAGVDLPHVAFQLARGETPEPLRGRAGARWSHASRDAVAAIQTMRRGGLRARDYAASLLRPATGAAFAWDDPLPGLVDVPLLLARMIGRRFAAPAAPAPARRAPSPLLGAE